MTKRELIDEIMRLNHTARPVFLAQFAPDELDAYLQHLKLASLPRLKSDRQCYPKYVESDGSSGLTAPARSRFTLDAIVHKAWQTERSMMFTNPLASLEAFEIPPAPAETPEPVEMTEDDGEEIVDEIIDSVEEQEEETVLAAAMDDSVADLPAEEDESPAPVSSPNLGNNSLNDAFLY